ncbi:MAG: VanW family protein [Tissierellia bacterium]|nr:VanW family protein [Tissierellia bacterium]
MYKNKKLLISLVLLISISICSCNSNNEDITPEKSKSQSELTDRQLLDSLGIYEGVKINGQSFTAKARLVAVEELKAANEHLLDEKKVNLSYGDKNYEYSFRQLGFYYDYDEATQKAFKYGREGSDEQKLELIKDLVENNVDIPLELKPNPDIIDDIINSINEDIMIEAQPGGYKFDYDNNEVVAVSGEPGLEVDRELLKNELLILKDNAKIEIPTTEIAVSPQHDELAKRVNGVIGSATTEFNQWYWERATNIEVSTNAVDGVVVAPGEVFSLNGWIGDTTYDKGYQEAIVLVGTKEVPGMGGGVCQTSTTLYQAVLRAGLEIVDRQAHTLIMPYSLPGLDAAVEYGLCDMSFRNNYDFPILIRGYFSEGQVSFEVLGDTNVKNYDISLFSELEYTIDYDTVYEYDGDIEPGSSYVKSEGASGAAYNAYRKNEATGEVEYLGTSYYPAVNRIVVQGPSVESESDDSGDNIDESEE